MMPHPSRQAPLLPGQLVAGKYRLLREIGSGAMGRVWAARNETILREVALKLLAGRDEELRLRLKREAVACGALQHRHIVDIYDVAQTDDGDPVLVMQLLSGETLKDLLARRRRLGAMLAASIARDIALALAAMHGIGIVHRDLKPPNIFLHREPGASAPVVKVLDFGVSKHLAAKDNFRTAPGGAVGTLLYMSPEQLQGRPDVDARADIWALGVVLFEMLAGVRPFKGDQAGIIHQIFRGEIPSISSYVRTVDPQLAAVVSGCMCRDRDGRLGPAERIAAMLDQIAGSGDPWAPAAPASLISEERPSGAGSTLTGVAGPLSPPSSWAPAGVMESDSDDEVDDQAETRHFRPAAMAHALPRPAPAAPAAELTAAPSMQAQPGWTLPLIAPSHPDPGPPGAPAGAAIAGAPRSVEPSASREHGSGHGRPPTSWAMVGAILGLVTAIAALAGVVILKVTHDPPRAARVRAVLAGSKLPRLPPPEPPAKPPRGAAPTPEPSDGAAPTPERSAGPPGGAPPATPKPGGAAPRGPSGAPPPPTDCRRLQFIDKQKCLKRNSSSS